MNFFSALFRKKKRTPEPAPAPHETGSSENTSVPNSANLAMETAPKQSFWGKAKNNIENWGSRIRDKADSGASWLYDKADKAADFVGKHGVGLFDKFRDFQDDVHDFAKDTKKKIKNSRIAKGLSAAGNFAAEKARSAGGYISGKVHGIIDKMKEKKEKDKDKESAFSRAGKWIKNKASAAADYISNSAVGRGIGKAKDQFLNSAVGKGLTKAANWTGQKASDAGHWISDKAHAAGDWVSGKVHGIIDKIKEKKEQDKDKESVFSRAGKWIKNKASSAADYISNSSVGRGIGKAKDQFLNSAVGKGLTKAANWTEQKALDAGHWISDKAHTAGNWVADKAKSAKDSIISAKDWGMEKKDQVMKWVSDKKEQASDWIENKKQAIREHDDERYLRRMIRKKGGQHYTDVMRMQEEMMSGDIGNRMKKSADVERLARYSDRQRRYLSEGETDVEDLPEDKKKAENKDDSLLSKVNTASSVLGKADMVNKALDKTKLGKFKIPFAPHIGNGVGMVNSIVKAGVHDKERRQVDAIDDETIKSGFEDENDRELMSSAQKTLSSSLKRQVVSDSADSVKKGLTLGGKIADTVTGGTVGGTASKVGNFFVDAGANIIKDKMKYKDDKRLMKESLFGGEEEYKRIKEKYGMNAREMQILAKQNAKARTIGDVADRRRLEESQAIHRGLGTENSGAHSLMQAAGYADQESRQNLSSKEIAKRMDAPTVERLLKRKTS